MAHNCVDWTALAPARKTPLLVLTHGDDHVYTPVPKELKTLQEIARKEFNLGDVDIYFLSSCASLCHGKPARVTEVAWEHISPYIGCATVQVSHPRAVENQPQGDLRVRPSSQAASGDERISAKRKQPSDADQGDQQDTTSDHGNDPRTSSTEEDEESSGPVRSRARRRVASEEEQEQPAIASQTTEAPPDKEVKQERVDAPSGSQSAEPDIPIKQEKHTSGNASQPTRPEPDAQTQADGEKLMIRVAHPPSNQEAKFMTKSSTSVGKVLSGACRSFGLDADLATLYSIVTMEDEGGNMVDLQFPCDNKDSISRAGAERDTESRFLLKMAGEA